MAVLIRQNRLARVEEDPAHLELQINLLAKQKTTKIIMLLEELRQDLSSVRERHDQHAEDRGKELSDHARFTIESGVKVFFVDPHSPWQRGTNENINCPLRQYFPKGTDLSRWSVQELQAVVNTLNARSRKPLGWKTPAEALDEYLKSVP